ncbi:SH3 domain-containing protein [Sphingomonas sp.]|uniref:SH3 domain-containing protein n=1 Tax=Sphingomonas sp. TaxID=28214 RepID=UPI0025E01526|nr:SH3 domain-containing protein [Sphingomonas sp.]
MTDTGDIAWFKGQFADAVASAIAGTPLDIDLITAIACQETGYIWSRLRRDGLPVDQILMLCVGDTIDARSAFPRSRAELEARDRGPEMFAIARQALVDIARYAADYRKVAQRPDKFCHGYGIFQYDIQFFLKDPDYFLERRWGRFDASLAKCLAELDRGLKNLGWENRDSLTDMEKAALAIAYNCGRYTPSRGLKQGFKDADGRYYGENFFAFLRLAHTVPTPGHPSTPIASPAANAAPIAPPSAVTAGDATHQARVDAAMLNVRSSPSRDPDHPNANVVATLPEGQRVAAVGTARQGWIEIETSLRGALVHGFVAAKYLQPLEATTPIETEEPATQMPANGIVAVVLPLTGISTAKRVLPANAQSLAEPGQPARSGATPAELTRSLGTLIDWLAVDNSRYLRYKPRGGLTFCNIYAHDYCHLAGVYLPRVWWNAAAIERLARGENVAPAYGSTIDEVRANDLFRWLRDFGLRFGWRRTVSLTELQTEVNVGAIGVIVARRKEDGRSGHIVAVVPETDDNRAKRNSAGEVIAPLQSQAGSVNFKYGTGRTNWWLEGQFAESAFWIHA